MVIQRWQSVLLLIASICVAIFCFVPFATLPQDAAEPLAITPKSFEVFFALNLTIAVLLFIAIFLFKNLKRQRTVTLLSIIMMIVSAVTGTAIVYGRMEGAQIELFGGVILLVLAIIAALWAYRRMGADQALLRAADRLR